MELAVGMFTLALLTSALCAFVIFIAKSLKIQNHLRSPGRATYAAKVELDAFAAKSSSLTLSAYVACPGERKWFSISRLRAM